MASEKNVKDITTKMQIEMGLKDKDGHIINQKPLEIGGTKKDSGKLRLDLIPPEIHIALASILQFGAEKYGDYNWQKGICFSRVYAALERHLQNYRLGGHTDLESGKPTLWHALCELAFLVYYDYYYDKYEVFDDLGENKNG